MKKIISVILAICMCVVLLVGCGDSTSESETSGSVTSEIATSENTTNETVTSETVTSETVTSETVTSETVTSETPTAMEEEPTEPEILFSSFCGDDLDWTLDSAGTLTISGTGEMDDYIGLGDEPWTDFRDDIETIVVESGVTSIGSYAFSSCPNITSIILPDSINRLGEGFLDKSGELIESFEIPSNVTEIASDTFTYCEVSSVTIPDTVTIIDNGAFYMSLVENIIIVGGVTSIGNQAFMKSALAEVTLNDGLISIGDSAFADCTGLTNITIPDSVESIGLDAFARSGLENVIIGTGLTYLGNRAFENCDDLTSMTFEGNPPEFTSDVFGTYTSKMTFSVNYPADNDAWTRDIMRDFQGYANINWIAK